MMDWSLMSERDNLMVWSRREKKKLSDICSSINYLNFLR